MEASSERHQVCIVRRCRDGHGPSTAHICMTELVREGLELICLEVIVIPQHVIMGWTACSLATTNRHIFLLGFSLASYAAVFSVALHRLRRRLAFPMRQSIFAVTSPPFFFQDIPPQNKTKQNKNIISQRKKTDRKTKCKHTTRESIPYLNASMATEIEVKLGGMCDASINCRARGNITTLATLQ